MKSPGLLVAFALALITLAGAQAFADPLQGASKQRIGNYDFEMTTQPKSPAPGDPTTIMLRFAGVNGDELVDVPITLRLFKDGAEIYRPNPIVVPYGHHNLQYTFPDAGRYVLYVDLNDYAYSGETLTFTFLINVSGPADFISGILPVAGGVAAAAVGTVVVLKKKSKVTLR